MSPGNTINAIIVDDEKDACRNLQAILKDYVPIPVNISGVAHDTIQAEKLIRQYTPDILFLDIEMPGESGFAFLDRIKPFQFEIIFVTAYDAYAVTAFRLNAVDYILKPISVAELTNAVKKLQEKLTYKAFNKNAHYSDVLKQVMDRTRPNKIIFRDGNVTEAVRFSDICYIEASGSYSKIFFFNDGAIKNIITGYPIAEYEQLLPADYFYRIHKSYLINCQHFSFVINNEKHFAVLADECILPISRRRYANLISFIKSATFR